MVKFDRVRRAEDIQQQDNYSENFKNAYLCTEHWKKFQQLREKRGLVVKSKKRIRKSPRKRIISTPARKHFNGSSKMTQLEILTNSADKNQRIKELEDKIANLEQCKNVKHLLEIKKLKNEIEFKESKIKTHSFTYHALRSWLRIEVRPTENDLTLLHKNGDISVVITCS